MGAADDQRERHQRSSESRERHLAAVRERAREELAGRLADMGERLRLTGAALTVADALSEPHTDPHVLPNAVDVTLPVLVANGQPAPPLAVGHPLAVDAALTVLDCSTDRDLDCHTYSTPGSHGIVLDDSRSSS